MRAPVLPTLLLSLTLSPLALAQQTATQQYQVNNLVGNISGDAAVTDPNLVNPWGLSRSSGGAWWTSDNGTGLSTLYDGGGKTQPLIVKVPSGNPSLNPVGSPTGTVFNGTQDFQIAPGKPALFLFATEDGTISGWNPGVDPVNAIIEVNEKQKSVFKGMTIAQATIDGVTANYLYVADFRRGKVLVYDTNFHHVTKLESVMSQRTFAAGFAPFNVQNLGGNIYVAIAKQDQAKKDEVDGAGLGFVAVASPEGKVLQVLEGGSWLNAPWGLAIASGDFGAYSHDVLVGNFGDGTIAVFNPVSGKYLGKLRDGKGKVIKIDGLWGLSFGGGVANSGSATALYFGAGPHGEQDGLLGSITAIQNTQGNDQ